MHQDGRKRRLQFAIAAGLSLFLAAVTALVAPWLGTSTTPRPLDYGAALFYAACLAATAAGLFWGGEALLSTAESRWPRPAALRSHALGRPLWSWLAAAAATGLAAAWLTPRLLDDGLQAAWVRLALDADAATPPPAALRYGGGSIPFQWQPYGESVIAVRPLGGASPLRVAAIDTDAGALALDQVVAREGRHDAQGLLLPNPEGALLSWPRPSRVITLTLAAGTGEAEVLWFDQRATMALGAGPTTVVLRLPGVWQGWALLPTRQVGQLALELQPAARPYTLRRLDLMAEAPQTWVGAGSVGPLAGAGCAARAFDAALEVGVADACALQLPLAQPLDAAQSGLWWLLWTGLVALSLGLLAAATIALNWLQPLLARLPLWQARPAPASHHQPGLKRTMAAAWLLSASWHLSYAFAVPFAYTNDSLNYYGLGLQLLGGATFSQITSERTPGYPAFIAIVVAIFGNTVSWIVIIQHLAMALLAPLVVWALWRWLPLLIAAVAGVLAACAPALSVMANLPHTEALFGVCLVAVMLVYVRYGEGLRPMLAIGLLLGVATMLRPAALLLFVTWLGWLALWGWCGRQPLRALVLCAALVLGHTAVAGPWQLHLLLARHTLDISDGRAAFTTWDAAVSQRRIRAGLIAVKPDQAVWEVWQAWAYNPYVLQGRYPELITGIGDLRGNQRFYAVSTREADSRYPERLRENQRLALLYNLSLSWRGDETYRYWAELSYFLDIWKAPPQSPPPPATDDSVPQIMPLLAYRWHPQQSLLRAALLKVSDLALARWRWVALLALLSALPLLLHPLLYRLLPGWAYWLVLVASNAYIGMPFQRYIVVVEPLLYVLGAAGLGALVRIQVLRRAAAPAPTQ